MERPIRAANESDRMRIAETNQNPERKRRVYQSVERERHDA